MATKPFVADPDNPLKLRDNYVGQGGWASPTQTSWLNSLGAEIPTVVVGKLTYRQASDWITELKESRNLPVGRHRVDMYKEPAGGWYTIPAPPPAAGLDTPVSHLTNPEIQRTIGLASGLLPHLGKHVPPGWVPPSSPTSQVTTMSTPTTPPQEQEPKTAEIMPTQAAPPPMTRGSAVNDAELRDVIKRDVLPTGSSDADLSRYLLTCREYGFSPLKRQIYAMKVAGRMVVEASIDGLFSLAESTGEYAGADEPIIAYEDDKVMSATATVYRWHGETRYGITAVALWEEYGVAAQAKVRPDVQNYSPWFTMPATMLGKVALSKALRRGFPRALSGLYEHSELDQSRD